MGAAASAVTDSGRGRQRPRLFPFGDGIKKDRGFARGPEFCLLEVYNDTDAMSARAI
jgi:hypothetical protein